MKIRLLVLGLVLFVSSLTAVNAQQHWHFFDCFSQFEPDFLTGPFNLEITDVFLDNNGTPWVQAGISGGTAFYFGRVVNGQWEFIDFPSSLQNFPPFLSNRASLVFDDSNVPWMTPGFVDMAQMVGLGTGLHKIENGGFNGIANTEWAVNVKKFNNDPLLYLLSNHKLARVSPASPSNVTYIYEQAEGVAPITLVDKAPNGDLLLYKRNSSTDSIVRVDTQGNTVGYDLSSIISQFSQNILVLDMKVDGNGSVWLYVSTGFVHTLIRYDFGSYDIYNQNSPVSIPDAMCTNMEMDENNDIWLFYEGYVVRFSNGVFNIEQAIGGPFWTTMGYSKMHFRKDGFGNIWYIGILEPDARYGLAVVNPSGLETVGGNTFVDWNQNQVFDAGDALISIPIQTISGFTIS